MTADLDLSPEAVERMLSLPRLYLDHEGDLCCERAGDNLVACPAIGAYPTGGLLNPDMWKAIPKFQALAKALSAENARLRAERDAAWQAGAEAMRGEIAEWVVVYGLRDPMEIAHDIRALPLPGQPKEGAPPFQAPTLDALLSVATDDEGDAIRACAARLAETEGGA